METSHQSRKEIASDDHRVLSQFLRTTRSYLSALENNLDGVQFLTSVQELEDIIVVTKINLLSVKFIFCVKKWNGTFLMS